MRILFFAICLCQVLFFTSKSAVAWEGKMQSYVGEQDRLKQRLAAMTSEQRSIYDEEQRELMKQWAVQRERDEENRVLAYLRNAFTNPEPGTSDSRLRRAVLALIPTRVDAATSPLTVSSARRTKSAYEAASSDSDFPGAGELSEKSDLSPPLRPQEPEEARLSPLDQGLLPAKVHESQNPRKDGALVTASVTEYDADDEIPQRQKTMTPTGYIS